MTYRYEGPADFLEFPGGSNKFYTPGQNVPISKDDAIPLIRRGHRFEGLTLDDVGVAEPRQPELQPIGNDGTPITDAIVSSAPVTSAPSAAPAVTETKPKDN